MPKTKQPVDERVGHSASRMHRDTARIVNTSPDSESKQQMKDRILQRQRVTMGDNHVKKTFGSSVTSREQRAIDKLNHASKHAPGHSLDNEHAGKLHKARGGHVKTHKGSCKW